MPRGGKHEDRGWRAAIGQGRPLKARSLDGTLLRVPDTPANRAVYGSAGTGDDSSPYPCLRALPLNDVSARSLPGMPHGPAGAGKAAGEQKLPDMALEQYPHLFTDGELWPICGRRTWRVRAGDDLSTRSPM